MTEAHETNDQLLDRYVANVVESALRFAASNPGGYADHAQLLLQQHGVPTRMLPPGAIYYVAPDFKNPIKVEP